MLQPDFDPRPTAVRTHRCGYISRCKKPRCQERATLIAEKVDGAGRHVRQIELCTRHCDVVIACERKRGLEVLKLRSGDRKSQGLFFVPVIANLKASFCVRTKKRP